MESLPGSSRHIGKLARIGLAASIALGGGAIAVDQMNQGQAYAATHEFDQNLGIETDRNPEISVSEKMDFVRRLQSNIERLPKETLIHSQVELDMWTREILPYFSYENLVDYDDPRRHPSAVIFQDNAGDNNFHVLGQAACTPDGRNEQEVYINSRMDNPESPWYGREDSVWVLTHELGHMQGGTYCTGASEDLEANTQLATAEVMAAMVLHGNTQVLRPLLEEIRDMGLGALEADLPMEEFTAFYKDLYHNDPLQMAKFDKSTRHWQEDPYGLKDILTKYEKVPFEAILSGLKSGRVDRVVILDPIPYDRYPTTVETHTEDFDDAQYLFAYPTLENIVGEVSDRK